jgi:hypothetical protein
MQAPSLAELVEVIERPGSNVKSGTSPLPPKCGPAESRFNFHNDILVTTLSQMLLSANSTKVTSNGPKMLQDFFVTSYGEWIAMTADDKCKWRFCNGHPILGGVGPMPAASVWPFSAIC